MKNLILLTLFSLAFTAGAPATARAFLSLPQGSPATARAFLSLPQGSPLWPEGQVANKQIACRTSNLQAILLYKL